MTNHSATLTIVRDDTGERCVVTEAEDVIWIHADLWAEFTSPDRLPMLPGSAELDGDLLTFGTDGEGLGRLTYRRTGELVSPHGHIVCERVTDLAPPACNVAGCDHARPEECEVVRCATCGEPYDGTEPPARHIARAHLDILARERFARGGIVRSDVTADNPGSFGNGCMVSDVARVFVLPDHTEES